MTSSTAQYTVTEALPGEPSDFKPRGGNEEFFYATDKEVMCSGPSETGKTYAACWKLHLLAIKYPGANMAVIRKTYSSMPGSVLKTFDRIIKGAPVYTLGGNYPERYIYENGTTIWVAGMDNPDKALSSERDLIYVNQAEEIDLNSWEIMRTRTTGRGAIIRFPQLIGDCNPAAKNHWIPKRANEGKMKLVRTTHKDNPTLFDDEGHILPQGEITLQSLSMLSGMRRERLFLGNWASPEGAVYEMFDRNFHVRVRNRNEMQRFYLCEDEGYTNPSVILAVGEDSDGRWHVFKEFYKRGVLQENVVAISKELYDDFDCRMIVVDNAAAGLIAALRNAGMAVVGAKGRVNDGIGRIRDRLGKTEKDENGNDIIMPIDRLTFDPSCENAINEMESYVWKPNKDEPVKQDDHCPDAIRYLDDGYLRDPNMEVGISPVANYRG